MANPEPRPRFAGIYAITNKITGRRYVGSSLNVLARLQQHQSQLLSNCHYSKVLQSEFNNYSPDDFTFEAIEVTSTSEEELNEREQYWIAQAHASEGGCFNRKEGGFRPSAITVKRKCSECGNPHYARGLCAYHWTRLRKAEKAKSQP